MSIKGVIFGLTVALSLVTSHTSVQAQEYGPQAGEFEVTLGGNGSSDNDFDTGGFGLAGSLGYFLTPNWEVALRQSLNFADFGDSDWNASTRAAIDYHFSFDRLRPYVGANFGGLYGDSVRETFMAGLEGGLKFYVQPKTFVFAGLEYQWLFRSASRADDTFRNGQFLYAVGIGFNF